MGGTQSRLLQLRQDNIKNMANIAENAFQMKEKYMELNGKNFKLNTTVKYITLLSGVKLQD